MKKNSDTQNLESDSRHNLSAYTLIELLVVVAIIAILVEVIIVSLLPAKNRAKDVAFKTTVSAIGSAAILCCDSVETPTLNSANPNPGGVAICAPSINSIYPDSTQVSTVIININCTDNQFDMIITPGTKNKGSCDHADCNQHGCTFDGC